MTYFSTKKKKAKLKKSCWKMKYKRNKMCVCTNCGIYSILAFDSKQSRNCWLLTNSFLQVFFLFCGRKRTACIASVCVCVRARFRRIALNCLHFDKSGQHVSSVTDGHWALSTVLRGRRTCPCECVCAFDWSHQIAHPYTHVIFVFYLVFHFTLLLLL